MTEVTGIHQLVNYNFKCYENFEVIPMEDKINALSNVTDKIKPELLSIYTKEHLINFWNTLEEEQKFEALKTIY